MWLGSKRMSLSSSGDIGVADSTGGRVSFCGSVVEGVELDGREDDFISKSMGGVLLVGFIRKMG